MFHTRTVLSRLLLTVSTLLLSTTTTWASTLVVEWSFIFDLSSGSHTNRGVLLPSGVESEVSAWDFGNSTQYNWAIFSFQDSINKPLDVLATVTHSGTGGGCSNFVRRDPSWIRFFEDCNFVGTHYYALSLETNTSYHMQTNAVAYSTNGELVDYHSTLTLEVI